MSQICPLFKREFLGYFRSPVAYVFLIVFSLASIGLAFFVGGFFKADVVSMRVADGDRVTIEGLSLDVARRDQVRRSGRYDLEGLPNLIVVGALLPGKAPEFTALSGMIDARNQV